LLLILKRVNDVFTALLNLIDFSDKSTEEKKQSKKEQQQQLKLMHD
jgi:hypothetical protein